jgi:outer membrane protein TolC
MKKILVITIMLATILFPQNKKLTLSESIEFGLRNSKDLKISQSKVISSDAKVSEIKSMFLPQFKFIANYTRLSDNVPPYEVVTPFSPTPIILSEPVLDNYNLKLSFQQPLFTGFKLLSSKKAASYNYNATELEYSKDKNEAAFSIHTAFWNYYKAQEVRALLLKSLNQIENHLKDTKNFLENGLATQNDYLKLQVQYSNTKLLLIEAENNLDVAKAVFNKSLGLPLESATEITAEDIRPESFTSDIDELLSEAKANRNELKSLQYKLHAANENITTAQSSWFPSIYLTGNYYYSNPNARVQPLVGEWNDTWDVGVTLSWDIWNWGLTSSQTIQAEELEVQTRNTLEKTVDNIEVEVYQSYLSMVKSNEKVEVSKLSLEQATENYRITSEKYDAQLATSTDLIDAEVSELQSATNLKTALVDYKIAKTRLEKSLGRKIY